MRSLRSILTAAAVAAIGFCTIAAEPARAQAPLTPLIDFKTEGGRVLYNYRIQVYTTGFAAAVMTDPRNPGEILLLTDHLSQSQVRALRNGLDAARFTSLPARVRSSQTIMDTPDLVCRFRGKTVRYTMHGQPRDPVISRALVAAFETIQNHFARIAEEPLVTSHWHNGMQQIDRDLVVKRGGMAHYALSGPTIRAVPVEGRISFAKINELKARIAAARWWSLPAQFPVPNPPPFAGDIYEVSVFDLLDNPKTVRSQGGATETRGFMRVMEQIHDIVHDLTT